MGEERGDVKGSRERSVDAFTVLHRAVHENARGWRGDPPRGFENEPVGCSADSLTSRRKAALPARAGWQAMTRSLAGVVANDLCRIVHVLRSLPQVHSPRRICSRRLPSGRPRGRSPRAPAGPRCSSGRSRHCARHQRRDQSSSRLSHGAAVTRRRPFQLVLAAAATRAPTGRGSVSPWAVRQQHAWASSASTLLQPVGPIEHARLALRTFPLRC